MHVDGGHGLQCLARPAMIGLYSSVAERQSCKLKVLGSIPSGGSPVRTCPRHRVAAGMDEARELRAPNLLIWSQTRSRCAPQGTPGRHKSVLQDDGLRFLF